MTASRTGAVDCRTISVGSTTICICSEVTARDKVQEQLYAQRRQFVEGLGYGRQRRILKGDDLNVVETDERDVLGHA